MSDGMTGDEDEPINEYRIKITVRNNLILNAIEAAGYKNVSEFCRAISISKTALTELIAMRRPPLNLDGEFSAHAKALMEGLCALPTDLWTSEQLTLRLKRNSAERDVSADGMRAALGMNAEETLELMKSDDLEETVLKQEMVTVIEEQLDSLGPRESKVLRLRFGIDCEEQTLEQIADTFDLTKERIRQIEAKALRKLKHPKRVIELRKLLPIYEITPDQKPTVVQPFCEHKNHQFYMNQNCISVCAHCGIRETVWDKRYE